MYLCDPVAFPTPNAHNFAIMQKKCLLLENKRINTDNAQQRLEEIKSYDGLVGFNPRDYALINFTFFVSYLKN